MAPKRRAAVAASASSSGARQQQQPRVSRLAKQHNISSAQEAEILEAFSLFCIHNPDFADQNGENGAVLRREDVRRCLTALGIHPSASDLPSILESLDPTSTGFTPYEPFLGLAAIYLNDRADSRSTSAVSSPPEDLDEEDLYATPSASKSASKAKGKAPSKGKGKRKSAVQVAADEEEIATAYQLFTKGGSGPITLAHLRKIAKDLREEVSDDMLRDMILEANGEGGEGGGRDGWKKGVGIEEFEGVMKRAGVFG